MFLDKINNRQQKFPSFHDRRDKTSELKNQAIKNRIIISGEWGLALANNNSNYNYNYCYQNNTTSGWCGDGSSDLYGRQAQCLGPSVAFPTPVLTAISQVSGPSIGPCTILADLFQVPDPYTNLPSSFPRLNSI